MYFVLEIDLKLLEIVFISNMSVVVVAAAINKLLIN